MSALFGGVGGGSGDSGNAIDSNESFKNLIIIPRTLFTEWQLLLENERALSNLDKIMKNIMYRKNLSDFQKWTMYGLNLIKYGNLKRFAKEKEKNILQNQKKFPFATQQTKDVKLQQQQGQQRQQQPHSPITSTAKKDKTTKIRRGIVDKKPYKEEEEEEPKNQPWSWLKELEASIATTSDGVIGSNTGGGGGGFNQQQDEEEYKNFSNELSSMEHDGNAKEEEENYNWSKFYNSSLFEDDDLEFELHKRGQQALGAKHATDVVRRNYSLGKEYRSFDNKQTGENVLIEVEPVKEQLETEWQQREQNSIYNAPNVSRTRQSLAAPTAEQNKLKSAAAEIVKKKSPKKQPPTTTTTTTTVADPTKDQEVFASSSSNNNNNNNNNNGAADDDDVFWFNETSVKRPPTYSKKSRAKRMPNVAVKSSYQLRSRLKRDLPAKEFAEEELLRKSGKRSEFFWDNQWKINT